MCIYVHISYLYYISYKNNYVVQKGSISCRILFIQTRNTIQYMYIVIYPSNHPLGGTSCENQKSCEFATLSLANGQSGSLVIKTSPTLDMPSCLSLVGTHISWTSSWWVVVLSTCRLGKEFGNYWYHSLYSQIMIFRLDFREITAKFSDPKLSNSHLSESEVKSTSFLEKYIPTW